MTVQIAKPPQSEKSSQWWLNGKKTKNLELKMMYNKLKKYRLKKSTY